MTDTALSPLYCAIDTPDAAHARDLAKAMKGAGCGIKLGLEFFSANGPDGAARVMDAAAGGELFLDLKYHDIPNTVAAAVRAVVPATRPRILNLHAAGGAAMMRAGADAAREAAAKAGAPTPKVIAVTVLTSLDSEDLSAMGVIGGTTEQVVRLATLAREAGIDGVVCSAHEIAPIRRALGADFLLVTPGIRPAGVAAGDQKRVMTPAGAIQAGADVLVMGRPITGADDPAAAARAILADIGRP